MIDPATGEVVVEANSEITAAILNTILDSQIAEVELFFPERDDVGPVMAQTLKRDTIKTPHEALIEALPQDASRRSPDARNCHVTL